MAACPQKLSKCVPKGPSNSVEVEEFNSDTLFLILSTLVSEKVKSSVSSFSQYVMLFASQGQLLIWHDNNTMEWQVEMMRRLSCLASIE